MESDGNGILAVGVALGSSLVDCMELAAAVICCAAFPAAVSVFNSMFNSVLSPLRPSIQTSATSRSKQPWKSSSVEDRRGIQASISQGL